MALGGSKLYRDEPSIALRELLQNARDAVRRLRDYEIHVEESLTVSEMNESREGGLNLGMYQLITRERKRLGIRLVSDYEIWSDEDTVLAGYEGYRHIQIDRGYPFLSDDGDSFQFIIVFEGTRERYPTIEKRQEVCECGMEFISMMKLAALSIGTAAVYGGFSDFTKLFDHPGTDLFWLNLVQSWITSSIASDRLRTFFVRFVRRELEDRVDKDLKKRLNQSSGKQPKSQFVYTQAFLDLDAHRLPTDESRQHLRDLHALIPGIGDIRLKRNHFVHDYASREAMIVTSQRNGTSDHADMLQALRGEKCSDDYVQEITCAYKALERAGNLVFLLEKDITERSEE